MTRHVVDAAVIGGGPIGLATAYELARDGASVVVFDRGDGNGGCAVGSAGIIAPSLLSPLAAPGALRELATAMLRRRDGMAIRPTLHPAAWRWSLRFALTARRDPFVAAPALLAATAALAQHSVELIDAWVARHARPCAWQRRGLLDVYTTPAGLDAAAGRAAALAVYGVASTVVDSAGARLIEPALRASVCGAIHYPGDANLHPGRYLGALRDAAVELGVDHRPSVLVRGWSEQPGAPIEVDTSDGPVAARRLVVAAGVGSARFQRLLGVRIPVAAGRGMSITAPAGPAGPSTPMLLGERHIAVAPMGDELRISGGMHIHHRGTTPDHRLLAALVVTARRRVDVDSDLDGERARRWAGLRPVSADGAPIIGLAPRSPAVAIATGHHMVGLTLGAGTGRAVARLITGRSPETELAPFAPDRFGRYRARRAARAVAGPPSHARSDPMG